MNCVKMQEIDLTKTTLVIFMGKVLFDTNIHEWEFILLFYKKVNLGKNLKLYESLVIM